MSWQHESTLASKLLARAPYAAFLPVLSAQRNDAELLAKDAEQRGWGEEAERHRRLIARLEQLIDQTRAGSA